MYGSLLVAFLGASAIGGHMVYSAVAEEEAPSEEAPDLTELLQLLQQGQEPTDPAPADPAAPLDLEIEGPITESNARVFVRRVEHSKAHEIHVRINTPGGDLDAAREMSRALEKASTSAAVRCTVDGQALSAGFYILQSCAMRSITARSILMAHEPWFRGGTTPLTRDVIKGFDSEAAAEARAYAEHCAARMKIGVDTFLRWIRGRDWWLTPKDAIEYGAADEILPSPNKDLKRPE